MTNVLPQPGFYGKTRRLNDPGFEFLLACNEQHVLLNDATETDLRDFDTYTGTVGVAMVIAGFKFGNKRKHYSARGHIAIDKLPESMPMRLLGSLLNASGSDQKQDAIRPLPRRVQAGICEQAEYFWTGTHDRMQTPGATKPGVQIFVDGDKPVLIRKVLGEATGLTLTDMAIGQHGVIHPAETIVHIETSRDDTLIKPSGLVIKGAGVLISPFEEVTAIAPGRLSAMAVPDNVRADYFQNGHMELSEMPAPGAIRALAITAMHQYG